MSGHSKWAQIKRKKAVTDAKRSRVFSKLAAIISIAAREKGGDPNMNPSLRMAIDKARSLNMPMDNIERAIKRGTGSAEAGDLEEIFLEAYGPGGKALLIKAITDNKNRTIAEIKHVINEHGGKMANAGSVKWLFQEKGKIILENQKLTDKLELKLIEAGAEDIQADEEQIIILTKPGNLELTKQKISETGLTATEANLSFVPKNPEKISEADQATYEKLFEDLDDQQDVEEVYTTLEF